MGDQVQLKKYRTIEREEALLEVGERLSILEDDISNERITRSGSLLERAKIRAEVQRINQYFS